MNLKEHITKNKVVENILFDSIDCSKKVSIIYIYWNSYILIVYWLI